MLVMRRESLEIREVIAGGRRMVREGECVFGGKFPEGSNRRVRLEGAKARQTRRASKGESYGIE